jgi:hypothetical protein
LIVWKPVWELVTVEYEGIRLRVPRDKETGLLACPICMEEVKKMKGIKKENIEDYMRFFFDVPSLIAHLASHAL